MLFIKRNALGWGDHFTSDIRVNGGGWCLVSDGLERDVLALMPFLIPTLDGDIITEVKDNLAEREAFANYVPIAPEPPTEETMLELMADQEYRLCMIELGLN